MIDVVIVNPIVAARSVRRVRVADLLAEEVGETFSRFGVDRKSNPSDPLASQIDPKPAVGEGPDAE